MVKCLGSQIWNEHGQTFYKFQHYFNITIIHAIFIPCIFVMFNWVSMGTTSSFILSITLTHSHMLFWMTSNATNRCNFWNKQLPQITPPLIKYHTLNHNLIEHALCQQYKFVFNNETGAAMSIAAQDTSHCHLAVPPIIINDDELYRRELTTEWQLLDFCTHADLFMQWVKSD
jgi:hypothetical protein